MLSAESCGGRIVSQKLRIWKNNNWVVQRVKMRLTQGLLFQSYCNSSPVEKQGFTPSMFEMSTTLSQGTAGARAGTWPCWQSSRPSPSALDLSWNVSGMEGGVKGGEHPSLSLARHISGEHQLGTLCSQAPCGYPLFVLWLRSSEGKGFSELHQQCLETDAWEEAAFLAWKAGVSLLRSKPVQQAVQNCRERHSGCPAELTPTKTLSKSFSGSSDTSRTLHVEPQ